MEYTEADQTALGHVRLAINDLSLDGAQPLHSDDGLIHAVVNGELYESDQIREELIRTTQYPFKGTSDSEIVIALYKEHGLSFLKYLRGEFAVCLYDAETQTFIAARDRYGVKPLFYTTVDDRLLVASEAKAFLPLGWKPRWDVKCLMDEGWRQDTRTPFLGVHKVRPGHFFTVNSAGFMEHRQYWDSEYPDKVRHMLQVSILKEVSDTSVLHRQCLKYAQSKKWSIRYAKGCWTPFAFASAQTYQSVCT